jgi:hypothetical protein
MRRILVMHIIVSQMMKGDVMAEKTAHKNRKAPMLLLKQKVHII